MSLSSITSLRLLREMLAQGDFASLSGFLMRRRTKLAVPLTPEQVMARLGKRAGLWAGRWPKFDLYLCAGQEDGKPCETLLLGAGCCPKHGGNPNLRFADSMHFDVRVGDGWVPYHRLVLPTSSGLQVHHKDGNLWNNRPENLEALTVEEHFAKHHKERTEKAAP
jgi:hypothetical protein